MKLRNLLFLLLFLPLCADAQKGKFPNPVTDRDWPDPTVWRADDGYFYSMATGGRRLLRSTNLAEWSTTDIQPFSREAWGQMRAIGRNLWAPDVTVVGGQRIAYVTLYNSAEDASIAALRETTPGHFEFSSVITRGLDTKIIDTIDPEVVTDPQTGHVWMFYGSTGGIHRVRLSADGLSILPGSVPQHVAGIHIREDQSRLRVFEGSYLHYRKGWWYLFVSAGWYNNATYRLCVGRSRTLDGEFLDREGRPMLTGNATVILQSQDGDRFLGPGHCGEIFTDRRGRDYILYHCHDQQMQQGKPRPMLLQRIRWDRHGWPYFQGGKPAAQTEGFRN